MRLSTAKLSSCESAPAKKAPECASSYARLLTLTEKRQTMKIRRLRELHRALLDIAGGVTSMRSFALMRRFANDLINANDRSANTTAIKEA